MSCKGQFSWITFGSSPLKHLLLIAIPPALWVHLWDTVGEGDCETYFRLGHFTKPPCHPALQTSPGAEESRCPHPGCCQEKGWPQPAPSTCWRAGRETGRPRVFQSTLTVPPPAQVLMTAWITKALVKRKEQSASTTIQTGWAFAHTSEKERITEIVAKTYRCKQLPEHL